MTTTTLVYRSLTGARNAFAHEDADVARQLSKDAHSLCSPDSPKLTGTQVQMTEAGHNEANAYLGIDLVLRGAADGIVISTIIVSLVDAAQWHSNFSPLPAVAIVACWALFLASREALELLTYRQHYQRERRREKWELENYPEGEVAEMVSLYVRKGLKEEMAQTAVAAMATEPEFFVDVMMLEELQMSPPAEISGAEAAARVGTSCFLCGIALPLVYGALLSTISATTAFMLVLALAAGSLCCLGARRALITHMGKQQLAVQTLGLLVPCLVVARVAGAHWRATY